VRRAGKAALTATALLALIGTARAAPPVAKPIEEKDIVAAKVKLDPALGYILVTGPERQFGVFLRVPDEASRAQWEQDRKKAFEKELKHYQSSLASWETAVRLAQQTKVKPPPRPVEPTVDSFGFEPLELRDQVSFGPMFVYAKGDRASYLEQVRPGSYIWYGNVMGGAGVPAGGTCLCMGTVRFEVKPGVVTDLGNSLQVLPHWTEDMDVSRLELQALNRKRAEQGKAPVATLATGELAYGLPASLKDWPAVQAELHANPKLNNYFGILVSRMAPIPGVLAYHRDTVVDGRTGQELASPTLVSRARPKL